LCSAAVWSDWFIAPSSRSENLYATDNVCPTPAAIIGGMIWKNTNEPVLFGAEDLREILEEYARNTAALLGALRNSAEVEESLIWRPHLAQMHAAIAHFADTIRTELENLGTWHADGRDLEEIHELVWEEGERLVRWLNRMLGVS
jgi:hypothetical protein